MTTIGIVIPSRASEDQETTLRSLDRQTFRDFCTVVSVDVDGRGANWARNRGFERMVAEHGRPPLTLFSDNDIDWRPEAIKTLVDALAAHPRASYAYGPFEIIGHSVQCREPWSAGRLKRYNFVSTMSLIRTSHIPAGGFDESLRRLQDWDLWLTMLAAGHIGVNCNRMLFSTRQRPGITFGKGISYEAAAAIVKRKHQLA